jgi:hypothetical protein
MCLVSKGFTERSSFSHGTETEAQGGKEGKIERVSLLVLQLDGQNDQKRAKRQV